MRLIQLGHLCTVVTAIWYRNLEINLSIHIKSYKNLKIFWLWIVWVCARVFCILWCFDVLKKPLAKERLPVSGQPVLRDNKGLSPSRALICKLTNQVLSLAWASHKATFLCLNPFRAAVQLKSRIQEQNNESSLIYCGENIMSEFFSILY